MPDLKPTTDDTNHNPLIFRFVVAMRELPAAKLAREFSLANLFEIDEVSQAALNDGFTFEAIYLAASAARVLVRNS